MPPPTVFAVEKWMDEHETTAKYNLAETCCASISISQLAALSSTPLEASQLLDLNVPQNYGDIRGDAALRANLASLYSVKTPGVTKENVLITPGAIAANYLVYYSLLGAGDHVVCQYPTYQQLYAVPESLGAEVSLWKPKRLDGSSWEWDVDQLKALLKSNTKMIVLNNPNNPTGAILSKAALLAVIELARPSSVAILSDEVYRPIFHSVSPTSPDFPPSMMSLAYEHSIVTGSMSKAYALAGLRVGWLASRSAALIEALAATRHYTAISVSKLDQQVASFATSQFCLHGLLARNISLAKTNVALLDAFVSEHRSVCEWVKPLAGTTAFIKFSRDGKPIDDVQFCEKLQDETGVMFLPGSRGFGGDKDFHGFVRVGFVNDTEILVQGLEKVKAFFKQDSWQQLPVTTGT